MTPHRLLTPARSIPRRAPGPIAAPTSSAVWLRISALLLALGLALSAGALTLYAQGRESDDRLLQLLEAGKHREVVAQMDAVLKEAPNDAQAHFWRGRGLFDGARFGDATSAFEHATKLNPTSSTYFEWLGNAQANDALRANKIRQGLLAKRMKNAWERAVQLDPENLGARESLIQFYTQAPGFMGGSKEKAMQEAIAIRKRDVYRGEMQIGNLHERAKRWADAERAYVAAADAPAPRPINARYRLGAMYVTSQQYDKAFTLFESLAALPGESAALYAVGRTAAISGDRVDRGIEAMQAYLSTKALPSNPSHAAAQWRLGTLLERKGDRAGARSAYEAALALESNHKEAREALKRLGS